MKTSKAFGQFLRYGIVGVTLNLLGYALYLVLTDLLDLAPLMVVSVLYPVSVIVSFLLNRSWTFAHDGQISASFRRFLLAHIAGYSLNMAILVVFFRWLGVPHQVVQLLAIVVVALFLFAMFRWFVFPERKAAHVSTSNREGVPE